MATQATDWFTSNFPRDFPLPPGAVLQPNPDQGWPQLPYPGDFTPRDPKTGQPLPPVFGTIPDQPEMNVGAIDQLYPGWRQGDWTPAQGMARLNAGGPTSGAASPRLTTPAIRGPAYQAPQEFQMPAPPLRVRVDPRTGAWDWSGVPPEQRPRLGPGLPGVAGVTTVPATQRQGASPEAGLESWSTLSPPEAWKRAIQESGLTAASARGHLDQVVKILERHGVTGWSADSTTNPSADDTVLSPMGRIDVLSAGNEHIWLPEGQGGGGGRGAGPGGDFGALAEPWTKNFSFADFAPPPEFKAPDPSKVFEDPAVLFRLKEGQKALERSAAAKGTLLTGGTGKALSAFGQDYASQEYQNLYGRALTEDQLRYGRKSSEYERAYNKALGEYDQAFNIFQTNQGNLYNRLAGIAGAGQTAVGQLGSAGLNTANQVADITTGTARNIGDLTTGSANARAAADVAGSNAYANVLSGLGSGLGSIYLANYLRTQGQGGPFTPYGPYASGYRF